MKSKNFISQNWPKILLFAISLMILVIFFLVYENSQKTQLTPTPSPQSKNLSLRAQEIKSRITKTDKKTGDLTSDYEEFTIDYLISHDQYIVTIKKAPFAENKKNAEEWFLNQGFEPQDICFLNIYFYPAKNVTADPGPNNSKPSGC